MKLSIIIPVFNEAATIETLLDRVVGQAVPVEAREILVVESNSTDGTRQLVQTFAARWEKEHPGELRLLLQERPRGKGNAVREALAAATGDIVLIQDGDLEYQVTDYPSLIQPLLEGRAKLVLGSRHLAAGSWKIRRFTSRPSLAFFMNLGGRFFHFIFNRLYGQRLTDPTTMYKVFLRECIQGLSLSSNRFDFDFEILAKLIRRGYVPLEVPISYESREFSAGKKIRPFRDPFTWIWAILKFRFTRI
jgi:glycosyltransferase involved in cell wall biosynthesis